MIDRQVDDLASVITGLAAGPCVLAGHSWGGILVQLLAFRRPDLVAGLVLVDPGHEEMESGLPLALRWGWRVMRAVRPDELHGDVAASDAALRELRAAARPFPGVPVVVLSAVRSFPLPRRTRAYWTSLQSRLAAAAPGDAMLSSTAPATTSPGTGAAGTAPDGLVSPRHGSSGLAGFADTEVFLWLLLPWCHWMLI